MTGREALMQNSIEREVSLAAATGDAVLKQTPHPKFLIKAVSGSPSLIKRCK